VDCRYCHGYRCECTCTEDCGMRADGFVTKDCPCIKKKKGNAMKETKPVGPVYKIQVLKFGAWVDTTFFDYGSDRYTEISLATMDIRQHGDAGSSYRVVTDGEMNLVVCRLKLPWEMQDPPDEATTPNPPDEATTPNMTAEQRWELVKFALNLLVENGAASPDVQRVLGYMNTLEEM
jgi:hypothetical protein